MIGRKVVFVIGATAVGKSKLGLELARTLQGEIVSADSMQIYQHASLMTAQPSPEELAEIPHHLTGIVPLQTIDFSINEYQNLSLQAIHNIFEREKTPIIVGGTMYYIESILYDRVFPVREPKEEVFFEFSNEELYEKLQEADPDYASIVEVSNRRKLLNAMDYIRKTGQLYSKKDRISRLRFPNYTIIWLKCEKEILKKRIRDRIKLMIRDGGLEEIRRVLELGNNYTVGVLQGIGYKEFEAVLSRGEEAIEECVENLVNATAEYAKKQLRWIKNRLQPYLDVLEIDIEQENLKSILEKSLLAVEEEKTETKEILIPEKKKIYCEFCDLKVLEENWNRHLNTRKHERNYRKKIEDDEIERFCEICGKSVKGMKFWESHLRSKRHRKKIREAKLKEGEF